MFGRSLLRLKVCKDTLLFLFVWFGLLVSFQRSVLRCYQGNESYIVTYISLAFFFFSFHPAFLSERLDDQRDVLWNFLNKTLNNLKYLSHVAGDFFFHAFL